MGMNTTVIVLNDALSDIENDAEFGKKLAAAIRELVYHRPGRGIDVSAGCHVNAAEVIETHHADHTVVVAVGGNYGSVLGVVDGWKHHEKEDQWRILEDVSTQSQSAGSDENAHRVRY